MLIMDLRATKDIKFSPNLAINIIEGKVEVPKNQITTKCVHLKTQSQLAQWEEGISVKGHLQTGQKAVPDRQKAKLLTPGV